jgi:hypothetical protein
VERASTVWLLFTIAPAGGEEDVLTAESDYQRQQRALIVGKPKVI